MKPLLFLVLGCTLSGCVPVARHVTWKTEQQTVTVEEGKEIIGLGERKKKSGEEEDFTFEDGETLFHDGETVIVPEPYALPLFPWKNAVIDFTKPDAPIP